jgi:antitoxin component YwqK of YwqJK toxin-antitoxin module
MWIVRDHPGDAISYFGASTDLANFAMINFATSKSTLISSNLIGITGNTNSHYTVTYYNGLKVMSDTSTYTYYPDAPPTAVINIRADEDIQAYPNPFTNEVIFTNFTDGADEINIKIYDVTGQLINEINSVNNRIIWNGKDMNSADLPAGLYICRIESRNKDFSKKVIVCKR